MSSLALVIFLHETELPLKTILRMKRVCKAAYPLMRALELQAIAEYKARFVVAAVINAARNISWKHEKSIKEYFRIVFSNDTMHFDGDKIVGRDLDEDVLYVDLRNIPIDTYLTYVDFGGSIDIMSHVRILSMELPPNSDMPKDIVEKFRQRVYDGMSCDKFMEVVRELDYGGIRRRIAPLKYMNA